MKREYHLNIIVLAFAFVISGCSFAPLAPNVEPLSDYTYVIGPGDNIEMFVWGNPEISRSVPVRPDGKISAPLIEELPATGKTPYQLARELEKALSKYIRNPLVTVIVGGFNGPYSEQIRVLGQAAKPQAIPYKENMSLLDLMIQVGGVTQFAAGNRAVIIRRINGVQQEFRLRIDDLLEDGDISANVNVLPGDILIVPEAYF
ncbi:XrtA/PEP-CTERM system exopolysaccharide export protein [Methylococcus sp. EFPC2]|uniref:XrtA/PEP-CTERM system exopolysaccharide export protein n=1 Tax=Methylococcus sp. EFPC2 TaxID=2812648 RepID=UPI0019677F32|nr:XrtA/PEP-CTERM system exopolysaccharide export protein [Methylococcus sp. EFPC2]QSA98012.1 polysaccharide export protein [Methylococcus sp. EFPC2]